MKYTNKTLEQSVLGLVALQGEKPWHAIADTLTPEDFGDRQCRGLFMVFCEIDAQGRCVGRELASSIHLVASEMSAQAVSRNSQSSMWQWLDNGAFVLECTDTPCTMSTLKRSVADIKSMAVKRRAAERIEAAYHRLEDPGCDPLEEAADLCNAGDAHVGWETLDNIPEPGEDSAVAKWGISEYGCMTHLDEFMPLCGGRCYVLAAKPGGGKSSLAVQMMAANAREGIPVAFVSMEMGRDDCYRFFRPHSLTREQMANIRILSCGNLTPQQLQVTVRSACRAGAKLIVVDHMQYVRESGGQKQHEAISLASRMMVETMKQESAALVEICQMTREGRAEVRGDRETKERPPSLADLRGSADLEQGASAVIFLWQPADEQDSMPVGDTAVEMKVAKNRWGPPCRVMLRFSSVDKTFTRDKIPECKTQATVYRDRMERPTSRDENLFT